MSFYEIAEEGCHSPLTAAQIRDLFYAGHVQRHSPCRLDGKRHWRTVDELFPLLKYETHTSGSGADLSSRELERPTFSRRELFIGLAGAFTVILAIVVYFTRAEPGTRIPSNSSTQFVQAARPQYSITAAKPVWSGPATSAVGPAAIPNSTPRSTTPVIATQRAQPVRRENSQDVLARVEQQRLAREQTQREQAVLADRMRAQNQRESGEAQIAAGTDTIVPLDTYYPVNVGGLVLSVRIHDNDVTSFDAWINGLWYHEVKKKKGATGSQTDETLIYTSGHASLFYVWELSGKLNHCRLRVRNN